MAVVTWYGHAAFKIATDNASVVIDPFFAPATGISYKDVGRTDMVLISHDHGDHVGDAVELCKATGAMLGAIVGTAREMVSRGVPADQMLNGSMGFNIGGSVEYKGIKATMTQAFHSSDSGAPAGYIIQMPGCPVIYHAGDTGIFSSMRELGKIYGIELALLPIGGVFTMDALQAAHACALLGCRLVVPMHWGTFPMLAQGTDEFRRLLHDIAPDCECVVMEPGQSREI